MIQQHEQNVERFYRDRCKVRVQCCSDSVWLRRRLPESRPTHNGEKGYRFTSAQFKQQSEDYDSIRVVVMIDTSASAGDDAPYRREYILKPYSKTRWYMSLKMH